jgi:hypothetical protein
MEARDVKLSEIGIDLGIERSPMTKKRKQKRVVPRKVARVGGIATEEAGDE